MSGASIFNPRDRSRTSIGKTGKSREKYWTPPRYSDNELGQAIDYTKERVDGKGPVEPLPERRLRASEKLREAKARLGWRNYDLVCKVCGEGRSFRELASSRRERDTMADNLRSSLDDLAVIWELNLGKRKPT